MFIAPVDFPLHPVAQLQKETVRLTATRYWRRLLRTSDFKELGSSRSPYRGLGGFFAATRYLACPDDSFRLPEASRPVDAVLLRRWVNNHALCLFCQTRNVIYFFAPTKKPAHRRARVFGISQP